MRGEDLAVLPAALAFQHRAEDPPGVVRLRHAGQKGKIPPDVLSAQGVLRQPQHLVGGLVRQPDAPADVRGQDRRRTGFDEHSQLMFGGFPQPGLFLELTQLVEPAPPALGKLGHEETRPRVCQQAERAAERQTPIPSERPQRLPQ